MLVSYDYVPLFLVGLGWLGCSWILLVSLVRLSRWGFVWALRMPGYDWRNSETLATWSRVQRLEGAINKGQIWIFGTLFPEAIFVKI